MPTLGATNRNLRVFSNDLRGLEDRITAVEEAQAHADRRFVRLLIWIGLSAFVAGGLLVLVYVWLR